MPKRSRDDPQPYVEAFPALDALVIERMVRGGRSLCEWVDELGRVVGHVRVEEFGEHRMVFDQAFGAVGLSFPSSGRRVLEIMRNHRLKNHARPSFLCVACGNHVGKVSFSWGQWKCRVCHKMVYLSQRAPGFAKKILKLDYVKRRLELGKESFETVRAYHAMFREHAALTRALINYGGYEVPRGVRAMVFAEWMSEARRPGLAWSEASAIAAAEEPGDLAPPPGPLRRDPLLSLGPINVGYEDEDEDPANDGFPASSRYRWPG